MLTVNVDPEGQHTRLSLCRLNVADSRPHHSATAFF